MRLRQKIMISRPDFETIIINGYIYVDKTDYIRKIVGLISKEERKYLQDEIKKTRTKSNVSNIETDDLGNKDDYYFMPGPRRFGKSLTLSVLENYYKGNSELFSGLKIAEYMEENDISWEQVKRPVIYIDFSGINCSDNKYLKEDLSDQIRENCAKNDINLNYANNRPEKLILKSIKAIFEKFNKKVVVIIDEYDKPIITNLGEGEENLKISKQNQKTMRDFYSIFKEQDIVSKLELLFITGISKFSKTSIFSALNNLIEVDKIPSLNGIIGYTEEELHHYFNDYVDDYAMQEKITLEEAYETIKRKYDGYRFTEDNVSLFNPFSIANALSTGKLRNYWFQSGTPSFLVNLIKEQKWNIFEYKTTYISESDLEAWDIDNMKLLPLLFQTGYLTVKEWKNEKEIMVDQPNDEVRDGFNTQLFGAITDDYYTSDKAQKSRKMLMSREYDNYMETMKEAFNKMSYFVIPSKKDKIEVQENGKTKVYLSREIYFQSVFYSLMFQMQTDDFRVQNEVQTSTGRIDLLIETKDRIFIYEFKCDKTAEEAISQIKRKKYAEAYKSDNKEIILFGINFISEQKNIEKYIIIEDF
jgi:hypothetical protein